MPEDAIGHWPTNWVIVSQTMGGVTLSSPCQCGGDECGYVTHSYASDWQRIDGRGNPK